MTQESLKAVFMLDRQTTTFRAAAHNLSAEKAVEQAGELEAAGHQIQTLDQPERHKALSAKRCKACGVVAENLSQQRPENLAEKESDGD